MHLWEIHPALVHFPIAFLVGGTCLDAIGTYRNRPDLIRIGQGTLAAGLMTGTVAAMFGILAFLTGSFIDPAYRNYVYYHFALNVLGMAALAGAVVARWSGRWPTAGRALLGAEVLGVVLLLTGGIVGHAMVAHGGAGIRPDLVEPRVTMTPAAAPRTP